MLHRYPCFLLLNTVSWFLHIGSVSFLLNSNFQLRVSNTYWFAVSFEGQHYCSDFPPSKQFSNHASCKAFTDFVSEEILKRLTVSALRVWGRVGDDSPPYLVLPWMTDLPFSLDRLADVPRYV